MRFEVSLPLRRTRRLVSLAWIGALGLVLAGCASSGLVAPKVQLLSQAHYAPTATIDVLNAPPATPFEPIARLQLADPTGAASSSQLVAQLGETAKNLGANALVVEQVTREGGASVAFNPAGGQMQSDSAGTGVASVTALAIRYKQGTP